MSDWNPKANEIFLAALEIDDRAVRNEFISQRCAGNDTLRREVELLLANAANAGSFLERPAMVDESALGVHQAPTLMRENRKENDHRGVGEASSAKGSTAIDTLGSSFIGPYKLLQRIGEGGMGEVWMAEQEQPVRRRVALKVIKQGLDTRQVIARFEAERQALAMMDHQNIARVLDAGTTTAGQPFFVMELVNGIPLTKYCDDNKLSLEDRLALFIPVCQAIQHAHQKGIVHRDLKPSNVLVTLYDGKPVPKVIDFGLAKALQHQQKLTDKTLFTEFGQVVGTLQYMSPEQAEMNALDIDTRTDVYSLGVMLYELLTGSTPIEKETLQNQAILKVLETIRETDPPRPSARLSSSGDAITGISEQRRIDPRRLQNILRGDLDWIVMKALEKDRTRRYDTATALSDDLTRFLSDEPAHACPPSTIYRARKFVRKNRGFVAAVSAIAILLVLGIIGTSWFGMAANVASRAAKQSEKSANFEKAKAIAAGELAKASEVTANESKRETEKTLARMRYLLANSRWKEQRAREAVELLYDIPEQHRHLEWYLARRQFEGSDFTLYGHCRQVKRASISADGSRIVSVATDSTARIWDPETGKEISTMGLPDLFSDRDFAISSNGRLIAIREKMGNDNEVIQIWDLDKKSILTSWNDDPPGTRKEEFSPDDRILATFGKNSVVLWDVQTGAVLRRLSVGGDIYWSSLAFSPDGRWVVTGNKDYVRVYDVKSGSELHTFDWQTQSVKSVAFAPDASLVAAGNVEGTIAVWDTRNGKEVHALVGHEEEIFCIAFSPDGTQLASVSADDTIRIWDLKAGKELQTLVGHLGNVNSVAFGLDGSSLISASDDGFIKIWDLQSSSPNVRISFPGGSAFFFAFSPDSKYVAIGGTTIQLWSPQTGEFVRELDNSMCTASHMIFSQDSKRLLVYADDSPKLLRIWDVQTGAELSGFEQVDVWSECIGFNSDGTPGVVTQEGNLTFWNASNGGIVERITGDDPTTRFIAISPDGLRIGSYREISQSEWKICVWDTVSGQKFFSETIRLRPKTMCFSPNGTTLGLTYFERNGEENRLVGIWNTENENTVRNFVGHTAEVSSLSFSADGLRIASASADGAIKLWDIADGTELCSFQSKSAGNHPCASFSPDGNLFGAIMDKGVVELWDISSSTEIRAFPETAGLAREDVHIYQGPPIDWAHSGMPFRYSVNNQQAWITERGDRIPRPLDWPLAEQIWNPSEDGHWTVTPLILEKFVALVDLHYKNSPRESAYRKNRAAIDIRWHRNHAELAEQHGEWYAATFHRAWLMKSNPHLPANYDALHHACDLWRQQVTTRKSQSPDVTAKSSVDAKPSEEGELLPSVSQANMPPTDIDIRLAPVVRAMLAQPRGSGD